MRPKGHGVKHFIPLAGKGDNMNHTPGPWIAEFNDDPIQVGSLEGRFIAMTLPEMPDGGIATGEDYANARLIAACPLMAEYVILKAKEGDKHAEEIARSAGLEIA